MLGTSLAPREIKIWYKTWQQIGKLRMGNPNQKNIEEGNEKLTGCCDFISATQDMDMRSRHYWAVKKTSLPNNGNITKTNVAVNLGCREHDLDNNELEKSQQICLFILFYFVGLFWLCASFGTDQIGNACIWFDLTTMRRATHPTHHCQWGGGITHLTLQL